jgi:membrane-bound inhibitor of C-type lysozyme
MAASALAVATATPALAADVQPPMNQFSQAFYRCDSGEAFMMTYGSDAPQQAQMTTSNDNKTYRLKRTPVGAGVEFSGGPVRFWTDGSDVRVEGTQLPFRNCKTDVS